MDAGIYFLLKIATKIFSSEIQSYRYHFVIVITEFNQFCEGIIIKKKMIRNVKACFFIENWNENIF